MVAEMQIGSVELAAEGHEGTPKIDKRKRLRARARQAAIRAIFSPVMSAFPSIPVS
ncbi:hypothetical protein EFR01_42010 [Sinorhizobium fredii]|nr:hypothetical protein EFR01_42010 [Sinorhizobium fredii]